MILTGENSLVVKQPFKTKCSVESELAAPLCAFFEMSADFEGGTSDLLSLGLLWCIFVASLGGFFGGSQQCRGSVCINTSQQCHSGALCVWKVLGLVLLKKEYLKGISV